MKYKTLVTAILLGFVGISAIYAVVKEARAKLSAATLSPLNGEVETKSQPQLHKVIAYYFHGNVRCPSCMKIEAYSADTIRSRFADQLKSGRLEWKVVNIDEPQNRHFVQDYKLYTKSVVLVEIKNGHHGQWKNLDKVWDHLGNKESFSSYVETELRVFLKGV